MKDIIIKRRKELNLTQQQLADMLHISDKVISKWETGRSLPDTSMLLPLSKALQISISDLFEGEGPIENNITSTREYEIFTRRKIILFITFVIQFIGSLLIIFSEATDRDYIEYSYIISIILFALGAISIIVSFGYYYVSIQKLKMLQPNNRTLKDHSPLVIIFLITYMFLALAAGLGKSFTVNELFLFLFIALLIGLIIFLPTYFILRHLSKRK